MTRAISTRKEAEHDLMECADFIARDNVEAAIRFLDEAALHFLAETPGAGRRYSHSDPTLANLRVWPIRGFDRYLILYREEQDEIDVFRVVHSARDFVRFLK